MLYLALHSASISASVAHMRPWAAPGWAYTLDAASALPHPTVAQAFSTARRRAAPWVDAASVLARKLVHFVWWREGMQPHVCVFMVGLPAAGKSTVINARYLRRNLPTAIVDLDAEMVAHPAYDPKDPDSIYRLQEAYKWADARVEERFQDLLQNRSISRLVVDGTGTNIDRQIRRMCEARAAGWFIKVLYVRVPVRTAIQRAALRSRRVSPSKIAAYDKKINGALGVSAKHADEMETVDHSFDMREHLLLSTPGAVAIYGGML